MLISNQTKGKGKTHDVHISLIWEFIDIHFFYLDAGVIVWWKLLKFDGSIFFGPVPTLWRGWEHWSRGQAPRAKCHAIWNIFPIEYPFAPPPPSPSNKPGSTSFCPSDIAWPGRDKASLGCVHLSSPRG